MYFASNGTRYTSGRHFTGTAPHYLHERRFTSGSSDVPGSPSDVRAVMGRVQQTCARVSDGTEPETAAAGARTCDKTGTSAATQEL